VGFGQFQAQGRQHRRDAGADGARANGALAGSQTAKQNPQNKKGGHKCCVLVG